MKPTILKTILVFVAFILIAGSVYGWSNQGSVPTDAEIEQIRKNIREMESVLPPPNYEAEHRRDIAAMRLDLRDKLQAQRNAMAAYLEQVRNKLSAERVGQIEGDIRNKDKEISDAGNAVLAEIKPRSDSTPPGVTTRLPGTNTDSGGAPRVTAKLMASDDPEALLDKNKAVPIGTSAEAGAVIASGAEAAQKTAALGSCIDVSSGPNTKQFSEYERAVCAIVGEVLSLKKGSVISDPDMGTITVPPIPGATVAIGRNFMQLQEIVAAKLIGREERGKFLVEAEEARTDKQTGGGPGNSGSTSLVVKGGAPQAIGFAVENGALTQSQSGTTLTFRGNPIGLMKLFNGKGFDESYLEDEKDPVTRNLKKTSFSVSFDASRGNTPGVFTASQQQVSGYSLRYEFFNERDPRHKKHQKALAGFLASEGNNLTQTIFDTFMELIAEEGGTGGVPLKKNKFKDPVLQAWFEETRKLVAAAAAGDVESTLKSQLDKFPTGDKLAISTRDTINRFAQGYSGYLNARKKLMDEIAKGRVMTFEYTNKREVNSPDLSNFRFIAATGILGGKADLTANASLTMYNSRPTVGQQRVRDFQFAGQFDAPFKVSDLGSFVFSFAGKYQRAMDNLTALDGTVVPNTKGDIAVAQVKLTIPIKGMGIQLPLSMSFANRTELIREKEVRANFGFTFDLDKIWAKLKPF